MSHDDDATTIPNPPAPSDSAPLLLPLPGPRYDLGELLGRGGMGEVRLARDTRIDREVAVKLMRGATRDPGSVARFFREAKVQGALEHPAVVPVHDLGLDPEGNPYFVMKRLAGITLQDVLGLAPGDARRERWPRPQLLSRFVDICLAIELAHTRSVIHRDIKPANIMLGDFGEAYILDWGIARVAESVEPHESLSATPTPVGRTVAGAVVGTVGYMAPEQARGEPVEPRSDVFSLGCVLFEILAGAPAMTGGLAALVDAVETAHHRPSERAPHADVAPELDDLCARATAQEPRDRPTARELAEGVQAYLDGDRDVARRRELAMDYAERARAALATTGDAARATAMRAAGRALAIDPGNATAQQVLGHLMLEAPAAMPSAAVAAADDERGRVRQTVMRWAARGYLMIIGILSVLLALPLRARWPVIVTLALTAIALVVLVEMARRPRPMRTPWYLVLLGLTCLMILMTGVMFGPLFVMPIVMIGSLAGFLSQPTALPAWVGIVAHAAPFLLLHLLEALGAIPATFWVEDGRLVLAPWMIELTPAVVASVVAVSMTMQFLNTAFIALSGRRAQITWQDRTHAQAWHLRQLLPHAADRPDMLDP